MITWINFMNNFYMNKDWLYVCLCYHLVLCNLAIEKIHLRPHIFPWFLNEFFELQASARVNIMSFNTAFYVVLILSVSGCSFFIFIFIWVVFSFYNTRLLPVSRSEVFIVYDYLKVFFILRRPVFFPSLDVYQCGYIMFNYHMI